MELVLLRTEHSIRLLSDFLQLVDACASQATPTVALHGDSANPDNYIYQI
jgi:hypothetical protein